MRLNFESILQVNRQTYISHTMFVVFALDDYRQVQIVTVEEIKIVVEKIKNKKTAIEIIQHSTKKAKKILTNV